jgi:hypothetical protein
MIVMDSFAGIKTGRAQIKDKRGVHGSSISGCYFFSKRITNTIPTHIARFPVQYLLNLCSLQLRQQPHVTKHPRQIPDVLTPYD